MKIKVPNIRVTILSTEGPEKTLWITRPPWVSQDWNRLLDWGDQMMGRPITLAAGAFCSGWVLLFLHLPDRSLWEEKRVRLILPTPSIKLRTLRRLIPGMVDQVIERGIRSRGYRAWVKVKVKVKGGRGS